jgi:hypothetical protein
MTYRELLNDIEELEEEQLDFNVMGYIDEEYYSISKIEIKDKNGLLQDGHPYLIVD